MAQDASDATTIHQAWSYLVDCKTAYSSVLSSVQLGKLPEAVEASVEAQRLVDGIPDYLKQTSVAVDLKVCPTSSLQIVSSFTMYSKNSMQLKQGRKTNSATHSQEVLLSVRLKLLSIRQFKVKPDIYLGLADLTVSSSETIRYST